LLFGTRAAVSKSALISGKISASGIHSQKGVQFFSLCREVSGAALTYCFTMFTSFCFPAVEGVLNGKNKYHSEWDHAPE
jgi:hypothetical protein